MSSFFTKSEARAAATRQRQRLAKSVSEILRENNSSVVERERFDVFLSHSIDDADLVLGVAVLLEGQGLSVYVDWISDPELDRSKVSKETAARLRDRMRQSKSLLYVATENASASKWMPWELGYFDGFLNGGVAVLPLLNNSDDGFPTQEYLGLYPLVDKNVYSDTRQEDIFVEERGKHWTTLKEFATGRASWRKYA